MRSEKFVCALDAFDISKVHRTKMLLLAKKFNFFIDKFSGDFLIRNETIESKVVLYHWPRVHRLEYKIQNHDDLLSFAQIDIVDTDVGRNVWQNYGFIDFRNSFFFRIHTRCTSALSRTIMTF